MPHTGLVQIFPLIPAPGGENLGYSECARNYLAVKPRKGDGEQESHITTTNEWFVSDTPHIICRRFHKVNACVMHAAALRFHGVHPSGAIDRRVMHDTCPVEQGMAGCPPQVVWKYRQPVASGLQHDGGMNGLRFQADVCLCMTVGTKWSMQQFIRVGCYSPDSTAQPTRQTQNPAPLLPMVDCSDHMPGCAKYKLQQCYWQEALMVGNATHPGQCLATCMRCDVWRAHLQLRGRSN